jgi:hypothetical protein
MRRVLPNPGLTERQGLIFIRIASVAAHFKSPTRRTIMAKGQQRKNKEVKKPKKQPPPVAISSAI